MRTVFLICWVVVNLWSCQSEESTSKVAASKGKLTEAALSYNIDSSEIIHYREAISAFLNAGLLRGNFNGSILVAKNGTIVYENYVGYRDLRTKEPLTATTSLQIASTSKPFTGAAILKLVQEGKLQLETTLDQLYPGFPYRNVTVKSLLNHRSGLPNYLYYLEGKWDKKRYLTNADVLNSLMTLQPPKAFQPDTRFQYCNTNYVLLALIIEKISGVSYPAYLQTHFFEPLDMKNTYVFTLNDTLKSAVSFNAYGGVWPMDYTDGPYGDKNIYSTPRDLLKWDQALYTNGVINQELLDAAYTPYSNERPGTHNYGLGWRLLTLKNGKKVIYHNGRWHGFNSAFARLPEENATIIILGNKYNSGIYQTARRLYNIFGQYDENGSLALEEMNHKE